MPRMRQINVFLPGELVEWIKRESKTRALSMTMFLRLLIEEERKRKEAAA